MKIDHFFTMLLLLIAFLMLIGNVQGISQDDLNNIVIRDVLNEKMEGMWVYAKPEPVEAGSTITTWYGDILLPEKEGWLFFIDDAPMQSWAHPCRYIFVDEAGSVTVRDALGPPMDLAKWKKVAGVATPLTSPLSAMVPSAIRGSINALPPCMNPGHCYAVIISGGADSYNNWERYYGDVSFMYKTLVNDYGYLDDHIIVLMSDGTDAGLDQHKYDDTYVNSNPDLDGDGDDDVGFSATNANIGTVFDDLQTRLENSDHLFIFTTDHGGPENDPQVGTDVIINLWYETMRDDQFDANLDKITATVPIMITMEQCYSGGFIDDVIPGPVGQERVIATAANAFESSWGDTFSTLWISAVAGHDKGGASVDADTNNDGTVSMSEAFIYARDNDHESEHPQYGETPVNIGSTLALNSCYSPVVPIANAGPDQTIEQSTLAGTPVMLDGSASSDPCGETLTYSWTWSGGSATGVSPTGTFPLGTTVVTLVVTADGRSSEPDTVSILVRDTTVPVLTVPANIIVEQATFAGTIVPLTASATDICDASVTITNNAPAICPLGVTTVTFTATDDSGNAVSKSMTVTVVDTTPPDLTVPDDVEVEQATLAGTVVPLDATASDICDADVEITDDGLAIYPLGGTTVTFTATDDSGNAVSKSMTVTVVDTTPPDLTVPDDVEVEQATLDGTVVLLVATASDICDADVEITDNGLPIYPLGVTTVIFTATDDSGNAVSKSMTVTVVDTTPPTISVSVMPDSLWPPNHKMVDIQATVSANDICDASPDVVLTSITSDEPDNGLGDGDKPNDIDITTLFTFKLRSERSGEYDGRVYTITYTATDDSGNSASATDTVIVPLEK